MSDTRERTRRPHGRAVFTRAAKDLRLRILSLLNEIDKPSDQVALHSQLLVRLWVRPFEDFAARCDKRVWERARRGHLPVALHKLSKRIADALRHNPRHTSHQQLRAAAKILVSLTTSRDSSPAFILPGSVHGIWLTGPHNETAR